MIPIIDGLVPMEPFLKQLLIKIIKANNCYQEETQPKEAPDKSLKK